MSEYVPNRRFMLATTTGPYRVEADLVFEPTDVGTRMTSVLRGQSRGLFRLAGPLALVVAKGGLRESAATLKTILEG